MKDNESLKTAARREMEKWWPEEKMFRDKWENKKAYDDAQSTARRNMGDMGSIGKKFW